MSHDSDGRSITFRLWHWHDDGEHYDQEYFQLVPEGEGWDVRVRRATSWALTRGEVTDAAIAAGFTDVTWHTPETSRC